VKRSRGWFVSRVVVLLATAAVAVLGLTGPASASAPYCGIHWGSLAKTSDGSGRPSADHIVGVRTGQHPCYDRLVVDLRGDARGFHGYDVRYAPLYSEGKGEFIPLRGAADLRIIVRAPAYDADYRATFAPRNPREVVCVTGYRTFRQVAFAGSFEGQTTFGLGVRARLPFRVSTLAGPGPGMTRLVIDVAHRW
jgi:hypothetical protein